MPAGHDTGLWLAVLGPLAAWRDGLALRLGPPRQVAVAGLLAVHGELVRRETVIDVLWGQRPPATAAELVQAHVSRLRRVLDPDGRSGLVEQGPAGYRLRAGPGELDVAAFADLAGRAGAAGAAGDAAAACGLYAQALALWRGEPAADVPVLCGHPVVMGLARRRAEAVLGYADAAWQLGWYQRVLPLLEELAQEQPLEERVHARLMVALAGAGQQAAAIEVFEAVRRRLDEELGVRPGPELTAAHDRVLRQDIPPARGAATVTGRLTGAVGLPETTASELVVRLRAGGDGAAPAPDHPARGQQSSALPQRSGNSPDLGGDDVHPVPRQLPAAAVHFVGRAAELKILDGLLEEPPGSQHGTAGAVAILAIRGIAGVGKTTLAVHWAHQVADQFPDGQLYADLRGFGPSERPVSPEDSIRGFLDALGVPAARIPAGLDAKAGLYRSLLSGRRMLVVLDNARDAGQVRPLLPGSPGCLVLVTSRSQLTGLAATEGACMVRLGLLTDSEARELLALRLGAARLAIEPGDIAELIRLCARLPLALAIAAARASARSGLSLGTLARELRDTQLGLDALETGDAAASARGVFSWSVRDLPAPAARMFRLLGLHPGPDITIPAAASLAGVPPRQAGKVLGELSEASLINEDVLGRLGLHDLLRAYAAEEAAEHELEGERRAAAERMLDHYLHTGHAAAMILEPHRDPVPLSPARPGTEPEAIGDDRQAMAWFAAEYRVLTALIDLAGQLGFDDHAWQLPAVMTTFQERRGNWSDYAAAQRTALAAAERAGDLTGQGTAHNYLGYISAWRGLHDEARRHCQQAEALFRQLGSCTGQARAHLSMGLSLDRQGRHGEALEHAQRALELYRTAKHLGGQAVSLNNCGWAENQLGHYEQALASLSQAVDLHRALGHQPGEAATWDSLGYMHNRLGHHAQAADCYARAVELQAALGDRWSQATALTDLGHVLNAADEAHAALDAWQQAADILAALHDSAADEVRAEIKKARALSDQRRTTPTSRARTSPGRTASQRSVKASRSAADDTGIGGD